MDPAEPCHMPFPTVSPSGTSPRAVEPNAIYCLGNALVSFVRSMQLRKPSLTELVLLKCLLKANLVQFDLSQNGHKLTRSLQHGVHLLRHLVLVVLWVATRT